MSFNVRAKAVTRALSSAASIAGLSASMFEHMPAYVVNNELPALSRALGINTAFLNFSVGDSSTPESAGDVKKLNSCMKKSCGAQFMKCSGSKPLINLPALN